jgi:hypothetical protein
VGSRGVQRGAQPGGRAARHRRHDRRARWVLDWAGDSANHASPIDAYEPIREAQRERYKNASPGDPVTAAKALLAIVDADEPPLRVLFGSGPTQLVKKLYADRLATWEKWEHVSHLAQGD